MSGSGTNHNMNHIVKRIETRVLAPPGGFSSISFGSAPPSGDIYKGHDFNPKTNQNARFPRDQKDTTKSHARSRRSFNEGKESLKDNDLRDNFKRIGNIREERDKENRTRENSRRDRRDSLDDLMENPRKPSSGGQNRVIPGLEGHISTHHASHDVVSTRNSLQQSNTIEKRSWGKNDYAEALRQQIETKKTLADQDGFESKHHSRGKDNRTGLQRPPYPQYDYQRSTTDELSNRRRGPPRMVDGGNFLEHRSSSQCNPQPTGNRQYQHASGGGRSSISLSWD